MYFEHRRSNYISIFDLVSCSNLYEYLSFWGMLPPRWKSLGNEWIVFSIMIIIDSVSVKYSVSS